MNESRPDLGIPAVSCRDDASEGEMSHVQNAGGMVAMALDGLAALPKGMLLNEKALADSLAVSPRTVRRMVAHGQLPAGIKLGGRRMWVADKIMEFLVARSDELAQEARRRALRFAGVA